MQEEKKENVYEKDLGTEQGVTEKGRTEKSVAQNGSTVPEKFASVDALVRAYESLQAEFTRRSQRLKELEKATENLENRDEKKSASGVEKLRKTSAERRKETKEFDAFIADTGASFLEKRLEKPAPGDVEPTTVVAERLAIDKEGLDVGKAKTSEADAPSETLAKPTVSAGSESVSAATGNLEEISADELFERANRDERVKLRIIGEYLDSIRKPNAPLATGGVGTLTSPPKKIASIGDAGDMALAYFKKPLAQ